MRGQLRALPSSFGEGKFPMGDMDNNEQRGNTIETTYYLCKEGDGH